MSSRRKSYGLCGQSELTNLESTKKFKIKLKSILSSSSSPSSSSSKPSRKSYCDRYYSVQDILGRRYYKGKVEYLVQWKGYSADHNSWEDETHITEDLIFEFNEDYLSSITNFTDQEKQLILLKDTPIKIYNLRKHKERGDIEYLVQWKQHTDLDWIHGDLLKAAFPQLLISFFESITIMVD